MRVILYISVLMFFISVILIMNISLPTNKKTHNLTLPVHKTVYIDSNISIKQLYHLNEAILEWNHAMKGDVTFELKELSSSNINFSTSIIIMSVTQLYPEILTVDHNNKNVTVGYYSSINGLPYILLVDERIKEDEYTAVIMHELGHALGLPHLTGEDNKFTLMYPTTDFQSHILTERDFDKFCQLYHCDPSKY